MRNLFDQYTQPENRLTHALLSCLAADARLLERFVQWSTGDRAKRRYLKVFEQSLPGDPIEISEDEARQRGLPDGCICDGTGWALLLENKIASQIKADQLRRHINTAARRGLTDCRLLVLSVDEPMRPLPARCVLRRWSQLYEWLRREGKRSSWARCCTEYFEVAEARGVDNDYLKEGTLTVFSGIPFGPDEPYSYLQGKRLLGLLRDELRKDTRLQRHLGIDPKSPGRGAITGQRADAVWDYIGLHVAHGKVFTQFPHLTIGIHAERMEAYVTVPNGVPARLRSDLLGKDFDGFEHRILEVTRALSKIVRSVRGAKPMIVLVQRHYATQRSPAVIDALLRFDPRTALKKGSGRDGTVKFQPEWLKLAYEALFKRKSNLQFQIGMDFPYATCATVRSGKIIGAAVQVWLACEPIIEPAGGYRGRAGTRGSSGESRGP